MAQTRSFWNHTTADISTDGYYRYKLTRSWNDMLPATVFVMLNPSTADHQKDDPTIRKCMGFARRWGHGGIVVVNLFALRSRSPDRLLRAEDPVGPDNDAWLRHTLACTRSHAGGQHWPVIAAWGAHRAARTRMEAFHVLQRDTPVKVQALRLTKNGDPEHPLYVPYDVKPVGYL